MNPTTQSIFCLEDFELVNPPKSIQDNLSTPYFHLRVSTKEKELVAAVMLRELVEACKAHAPAEARYIEQLSWYVLNGGLADFQLLQAMEDEGFEVERLMLIYLENEPWWERLRLDGLDEASLRLHTILYPESQLAEFAKVLFSWRVSPPSETISALAIAEAFQLEVWNVFPEMNNLPQKEVAGFIEKVVQLSESYLTSEAVEYESYLETGSRSVPDPFPAEFDHSLEGIRQQILKSRQRFHQKPNNPSTIKVEILEIQYHRILEPDNRVSVWYKATSNEGVFYDFVGFKELIEEAALHFPEWYDKIEALRESIDAIRPKEKEIVDALLAEHFDFIPLLESYVNDWVNAEESLDFERSIQKRNIYENRYDMHLKSPPDYGSGLEQGRKIKYLIDRLEDIAYDKVCEFFPVIMKAAKPWMVKSLRQSAHLVVFELMDDVWGLISLCEEKGLE